MDLNLKKVAEYIRSAETEELLNRATVFRGEMEPAALDLIEGELSRRGVTGPMMEEYRELRIGTVLLNPSGDARRCHFCDRPAVARTRGWFKLWRKIPIIPKMFDRCEAHP
jgi:hypothetical protein